MKFFLEIFLWSKHSAKLHVLPDFLDALLVWVFFQPYTSYILYMCLSSLDACFSSKVHINLMDSCRP